MIASVVLSRSFTLLPAVISSHDFTTRVSTSSGIVEFEEEELLTNVFTVLSEKPECVDDEQLSI